MALPTVTPLSFSGPEIRMLHLANRLRSFAGWEQCVVPIEDLAEAGYFASDHVFTSVVPDIVQCFHCGSYAGCWIAPCDPLKEHNRMSPHCEFAKMKLRLRKKKTQGAPKKEGKTKPVNRESPRIKNTKKKLFVSSPSQNK